MHFFFLSFKWLLELYLFNKFPTLVQDYFM